MSRNWITQTLLIGLQNGITALKRVWQFLLKQTIALLGIDSREIKTYIHICTHTHIRTLYTDVHSNFMHNSQKLKLV